MKTEELKQRAMRLSESGTASEVDVRELAYLLAQLAEKLETDTEATNFGANKTP